jgi:hypothetical protein
MQGNAYAAVAGLILLIVAPRLAANEQPREGYSFSVNGKAEIPQITLVDGTADSPRPGDVVSICGFRLVLGGEQIQRYQFDEKEPNILWIEANNHKRVAAAVRVGWDYKIDTRVLVNPLRNLKPDEISRLRGISLEGWSNEVAQAMTHINAETVCIEAIIDSLGNRPYRIPPLSRDLRYLSLQEHTNQGLRDFRPLLEFKKLRYLDLGTLTVPFDCDALVNASQLEHLSIVAMSGLVHLDSVRRLTTLRSLELSYNFRLQTIDVAADLPNLRTLGLRRTGISDLRPLAGHPNLEVIDADYSPVEQLPLQRRFPALRRLELLSTAVSDAVVTVFVRRNPQCHINRHFLPKLAPRLAGIDRLRVRDTDDPSKTLYVERDPAVVRALVDAIKIDDSRHGGHCMCIGWPAIEFYRQDQLVESISVQHWRCLRWSGWPEDGIMTADCAAFVRKWMAEHSSEIRAAQDREEAALNAQARETERFLAPFPVEVRRLLTAPASGASPRRGMRQFAPKPVGGRATAENGDPIVREIAAKMPDEVALAVACCRALGSLEGIDSSWTVSTNREQRAIAAALNVSGDAFVEALDRIQSEPRSLEGAARLYFYERMDRRLSQEACRKWTARIAEVVVSDKHSVNQPALLRALTTYNDPDTVALLKDILQGKKGIDAADDSSEEPSLRVQAAVTLARGLHAEAKPLIEAQLAAAAAGRNRDGFEVALALLGDFDRLKAEQFRSPSFGTALGAIEATERAHGAYGLDFLIEHGVNHQWAIVGQTAEQAVARITGQRFRRGDDAAITRWWKTQGPAFVTQRRNELRKNGH